MVATKKEQAALKQEYLDLLSREVWPNDPHMIDYCRKKIICVVRLESGGLVEIEKPRIETNFCFGYSDSSYNTDDYDRANRMAEHAASSEEYFIQKNMDKILDAINWLKKSNIYSRNRYCGTESNSRIRALEQQRVGEPLPDGTQLITEKDRAAMIEAWEMVGQDFRKRLGTYLKRYGMSKVHSWSYWRDA